MQAGRQQPATKAPERLAALLYRYAPYDPAEDPVRLMRYQFLSALAGTEAEAKGAEADHRAAEGAAPSETGSATSGRPVEGDVDDGPVA